MSRPTPPTTSTPPGDSTLLRGHTGFLARLPWLVGTALFVAAFVVVHQRPGHGPTSAAWGTLAGSVLIWAGVLPWLALWWWSAAGWGLGVCRLLHIDRKAGRATQVSLGAAALMVLTWVTQWGVGLNRVTMGAPVVIGIVVWLASRGPTVWKRLKNDGLALPALSWPGVTWALPLAALAVAVTLPAGTVWRTEAFAYDVLSYHLNVPRQWLDAGAMTALPHDVYGYLPNLVESTFGLFFALRGSADAEAVYLAQGFHASWALLAAWSLGGAVRHTTGNKHAGYWSGTVLLAVPWVLVTGSLAYNEMVVLALAAAALRLVLAGAETNPVPRGVAVGLLVGAATLAKLTAGFMVAVPLGVALLLARANGETLKQSWRASLGVATAATLAGTLVLSPFLIRNAVWTGNPVFPFAAETLGTGHWDQPLVDRWNAGHGLSETRHLDASALARQWALNTGYGAVGGRVTPREAQNIARFDREYGLPVFWLGAALSAGLLMATRRHRKLAAGLVAWIVFQLVAWHVVTHLQSRFLITTIVPGAALIGLGLAELFSRHHPMGRVIGHAVALGVVTLLSGLSVSTFWSQTQSDLDPDTGERTPLPPWLLTDALSHPEHPFHPGLHPVNALPPDAGVLVVADTSRLFYLEPRLVYASAFDASPLGEVFDEAEDTHTPAVKMLKQRGVTHLWVGWSELRRLHATYGHDARVTEDAVRELISGWPVVIELGASGLYALPSIPNP